MAISNITLYALPNEKALFYLEGEEQSPGSRGFHRYRVWALNRDGNLAEYREDMGEDFWFRGAKKIINIPSLWEHSVQELRELANELRWENDIDVKELLELEDYKLA